MNLFVTTPCPIQSAKILDDKRCIKMILESCQLLSTAARFYGGTPKYKSTHLNHPVTIWTRKSRSNYLWVYQHAKALCNEYTLRYGKTHACEQLLPELLRFATLIPNGPQYPFVNCARNKEQGVDYTNISDVHVAYQKYLSKRWDNDKKVPTWNKSSQRPVLTAVL